MQRIGITYHDHLPYKEFDGQPMPKIRVMTGSAAVGVSYSILSIGANFDVFISRERLAELRDRISDYLDATEVSDDPEPEINADNCGPSLSADSPHGYAMQKGRA